MTDEVTTHSRVDGESTRFGHGWYSGVVGILLGGAGLGTVLCFQFPYLFTTPQLRNYYHLEILRAILHLVLVAGFVCGVTSMVLQKKGRCWAARRCSWF